AVGHAVVNTEHRQVAAFLTAALQQNDVLDASIRVGIDLIHRTPRIARTFGFVRDLEYVALLVLAKNVVVSESDRTRPSCRENDHCYYVPEHGAKRSHGHFSPLLRVALIVLAHNLWKRRQG